MTPKEGGAVHDPSLQYILRDGVPVPCEDVLEWGRWLCGADRIVGHTKFPGVCEVATDFVGLDRSSGEASSPVLWETVVDGGPINLETWRYSSAEEARNGHEEQASRVRQLIAWEQELANG
jgi:hypothetical protein